MKFYCESCGYRYSPKGKEIPEKCPYCDRKGSLKEVKSAQDWINEV